MSVSIPGLNRLICSNFLTTAISDLQTKTLLDEFHRQQWLRKKYWVSMYLECLIFQTAKWCTLCSCKATLDPIIYEKHFCVSDRKMSIHQQTVFIVFNFLICVYNWKKRESVFYQINGKFTCLGLNNEVQP